MLPPEEELVVFEVVTVASMMNNVRMMLKMGMLMPMTCTTMTKLTFYKSCCRNTAKQGCISCGILVSGIRARGVSSEHMKNMELFSCSPT